MPQIVQTEVFAQWFASLRDAKARAVINARLRRVELGNLGDCAPVGEGVSELRIHYGPGYRVYFVQRDLYRIQKDNHPNQRPQRLSF